MMTKLYADRLAEYGIGVFEISPGIIATDMTSVVKDKYDKLIAEGLTPIRRWGQPEDIAKAVLWLVSPEAAFLTGQVITVDFYRTDAVGGRCFGFHFQIDLGVDVGCCQRDVPQPASNRVDVGT